MLLYNMKQINSIQEWIAHRATIIKGEDPSLIKRTGRRGEYLTAEPVVICSDTIHTPIKMSPHLREIVACETDIIYHGRSYDPVLEAELYRDDAELLACYKNLQLHKLYGNGRSRNNIRVQPECCLNSWQLLNDLLVVYSRSWDVRTAGLSDVYVVNNIAKLLGASQWVLVAACPHVYTDKTQTARRPDASIGI